ncbi:MAG: selenide, water dikinase SelD, partial [Chloroflexota bacterium]
PEALAQVLQPLHNLFDSRDQTDLLVGLGVADDAAIYRLNDQQAIINTVDFFTPVVDDPYDYGAIAAANSMSDVYAMGGEVTFVLNIGAFPGDMDPAIITEILRGGADKVLEAGAVVAGGHTVTDDEPKFGLAVTGLVHPDRFFTKGGAQPGDYLVLTKPLGTGSISTALKRDMADPTHVEAMVASMKRLNREAAQAAQIVGGVQSATDVTGFGLLGHGMEMANASGCKFVFEMSQMPLLEGVATYAAQFIFPGGAANNQLYFEKDVHFATAITEPDQRILWDPQTSGGLLLALPANRLDDFQRVCQEDGRTQMSWVIGQVTSGNGIEVIA